MVRLIAILYNNLLEYLSVGELRPSHTDVALTPLAPLAVQHTSSVHEKVWATPIYIP